jgi:hypothetical protein
VGRGLHGVNEELTEIPAGSKSETQLLACT